MTWRATSTRPCFVADPATELAKLWAAAGLTGDVGGAWQVDISSGLLHSFIDALFGSSHLCIDVCLGRFPPR